MQATPGAAIAAMASNTRRHYLPSFPRNEPAELIAGQRKRPSDIPLFLWFEEGLEQAADLLEPLARIATSLGDPLRRTLVPASVENRERLNRRMETDPPLGLVETTSVLGEELREGRIDLIGAFFERRDLGRLPRVADAQSVRPPDDTRRPQDPTDLVAGVLADELVLEPHPGVSRVVMKIQAGGDDRTPFRARFRLSGPILVARLDRHGYRQRHQGQARGRYS